MTRAAYFDPPDPTVRKRAVSVRLLVLDVDGVLTDGSIYMGTEGELLKAFHIHDGKGLRMAMDAGIEVAVLTARRSDALLRRTEELGIRRVIQGSGDKGADLARLCTEVGVEAAAAAFVGDDLVDLPALRRVGLAVAVGDAHPAVAAGSHWQTRRGGGRGAVREVCELILDSQGLLDLGGDAAP